MAYQPKWRRTPEFVAFLTKDLQMTEYMLDVLIDKTLNGESAYTISKCKVK